jgi:hypothetical protein
MKRRTIRIGLIAWLTAIGSVVAQTPSPPMEPAAVALLRAPDELLARARTLAFTAAASAPVPAVGPTAPNPPTTSSATQAKSPTSQIAATNSAADQCAVGLPADSKMIYDAAVRNMKGLDTLRDTVVAQTRLLVLAGKISEVAARPAAEKAGTCLRLLVSH